MVLVLGAVAFLQPMGDGELEEVEELDEVEEQGDGSDHLSVDGEDGLLRGPRNEAVHRMRTWEHCALKLRCNDEAIVKQPQPYDEANF